MAGAEGFEPPVPGPKPGALPLGDAPLNNFNDYQMNNRQSQNLQKQVFLIFLMFRIH